MTASPSPRRGFTLVEMLVAVSILSVMLVMMTKIIGMAQLTYQMAQNRIDNYTEARSMLDLITGDLERGVFRGDLPIFGAGGPATTPAVTSNGIYYFTVTTSTTAFYTMLPGATGTSTSGTSSVRDVSLVSYVLNSTNQGEDKIILQRSDLPVPWTSSQNLSFQGDITSLLQSATPCEVAPGVVGFRLAFRRADGTVIDQTQYTGYNSANPVVSVNAALAVVSQQSLNLLTTAELGQIQTALASATITNGIKATWDQQVLIPSFYTLPTVRQRRHQDL